MLRRPSSSSSAPRTRPLETDRLRLHQEEEEIRRLEEKIRRQAETAQRKLEKLPQEMAERKRKQQELMRLHLVSSPTRADGLSKLRDKRHPVRHKPVASRGKRMAERRAARMQFILLSVVLGIILLLLWKSLPS
ncbi:MAG: hypothetical protein A3F67_06710 [Verrucomicrobia bacterium RIFCSPHIGHO2_12_FULL_41_10]|nr:MAG: hypothetical protein A3F67_06710 [Verrucomicrobia bacterium RIFCSPHIGHO2_12_FULL_41_10]HLB32640.1 hypothetical protein [Chthoniobacterales bacterium]